ncbi:MAG: hypothetical protein JXA33_15030 [Anaerolineae bacterium]|nr:hypothetical protein [Anaerolineae bacterium]
MNLQKVLGLYVLSLILIVGLAWPAVVLARPLSVEIDPVVHILYFYSVDCEHCKAVEEEVLSVLTETYGSQLDIRMFEISTPENYELLIRAEEQYGVADENRGLPTLIIGNRVLIGEDPIREHLSALVAAGVDQGGIALPDLPAMESGTFSAQRISLPIEREADGADDSGVCSAEDATACSAASPIWMAYFYQVGCQECSRAEVDIHYMRQKYPQLTVEEFNIYDDAALAQWLAERVNRTEDLHTPALFIGDDVLIGQEEITPQKLEKVLEKYVLTGASKVWEDFDPEVVEQGLVDRFRSFGPLTVVFAGLVDGLNPCAFATLIFFISYLTIGGRTGREALLVGIAFTLGVFLAYLVMGLGFYKVLDLLGSVLTTLGRWVYGLTALLCAVLAVYSFLDFLKARRGDIGDMSLNLPHALRKRINAVIRKGRRARTFVAGAFVTGIIISFLELACTGQVYLPTIIFVSSIPELRVRAMGYLFLYNLLFVLPLIVVFILAYYGTTSKDLTRFLQQNAAAVKLGMVLLFTSLSIWLGTSLLL